MSDKARVNQRLCTAKCAVSPGLKLLSFHSSPQPTPLSSGGPLPPLPQSSLISLEASWASLPPTTYPLPSPTHLWGPLSQSPAIFLTFILLDHLSASWGIAYVPTHLQPLKTEPPKDRGCLTASGSGKRAGKVKPLQAPPRTGHLFKSLLGGANLQFKPVDTGTSQER